MTYLFITLFILNCINNTLPEFSPSTKVVQLLQAVFGQLCSSRFVLLLKNVCERINKNTSFVFLPPKPLVSFVLSTAVLFLLMSYDSEQNCLTDL